MKKIITLFVLVFVFAIVSASAQVQAIPMGNQNQTPNTTVTPATKVPVIPVPQVSSKGSVTRTRVIRSVVKKYYMNGVDKVARADNLTQNGRLDNLETIVAGKADKSELSKVAQTVNDHESRLNGHDRELSSIWNWTIIGWILIPLAILIVFLLIANRNGFGGGAFAAATANNGSAATTNAPAATTGVEDATTAAATPVATMNHPILGEIPMNGVHIGDVYIDSFNEVNANRYKIRDDYKRSDRFSSVHYVPDSTRQGREQSRRDQRATNNPPSA